ncbi:DNA ligase 1 [Danaus plexippus]|uniref:DNA ligase 1 n=1 Tax=Danaus plexippus TaxID=13037 RepID=UPI002AAFBEC9|nr:DNA ligase 1 [Danaus plexippus]
MFTSKLFNPCSLVVSTTIKNCINLTCSIRNVKSLNRIDSSLKVLTNSRNMSQKSIKSFFKITPKKTEVITEAANQERNASPSTTSINSETDSPNGNAKRGKRLRSSSSEHESGEVKKIPSPSSSEKKKKVKRQRIESSESETENTVEEEKMEVKLENNNPPKTYASPKAKKMNEKKIKIEKERSPESNDRKTEIKSPSPVKMPKNKANGNIMSSFVKIERPDAKKDKENITDADKDNSGIVKEVDYNPGKTKYNPIKDACWKKSQDVPYLALAKTLEVIEATSARLKMVEILSNYFKSVIALTPEDLLPSIYLCLNQLAPAYKSLELGIAETYLMKAVGQCTGRTLAQMKAAAQRCGDLGLVAEQARATQRTMFAPPPLTVRKVITALRDVAAMTGQASVNKKIGKIQSLYVACRHSEARYLIRSLEGKLRVGLAEQSLLQALAQAMAEEDSKSLIDEYALIIKTTYCECPNYDLIVPVLLQHGVRSLPEHCRLTPGLPLKPMLAHPTKGVHEVFNRFDGSVFTCEYKYDGERAQIHVPGCGRPDLERAAIYSRNQEDNTSKYPDIIKRLPSLMKESVRSCVLDCEAVAYDTTSKQILPFQVLSTRKRKDASEDQIKVQVCVFVFDLLYLNGEALVREDLEKRRELLRQHFNEVEGEWQFAVSRDCTDEEEVAQFLQESVKASCEGLMVKALRGENARYDIARRSHNWLKLKKDYLEGVGDSVDAVVIGAYHGRGKRTGVYGGFLLACYDPAHEQYQSLCKIGTGFSDEDLRTLSDTLAEHVVDGPRSYYLFDSSHSPDVWFSPSCVWEVRCADLSLSPAHRAALGLVHDSKGISLRFPRFIRVRDDKSAELATSAEQIAELYLRQDQVKNTTNNNPRDDFY